MSDAHKLEAIQQFINKFEYNYSGKPFVKMKRTLGADHVFSCAEEIMTVALPIQCVEATFIGLYLTCGHLSLTRIPLSFKSCFQDGPHRHMVLAVRTADGMWGTLGISRRQDLMNKPCVYNSLFELVLEFKRSYECNFHRLCTVYVGLPFTHQMVSNSGHAHGREAPVVQWKALKMKLPRGHLVDVTAPSSDSDPLEENVDSCGSGAGSSDDVSGPLRMSGSSMLRVRERCDLFTSYIGVS